MSDTYSAISRGTIHPTAKAGGLSLPLDPTIVRPGRSCPNCRILLNSGRCPKCRKKQAIGKNLAGRRRGI